MAAAGSGVSFTSACAAPPRRLRPDGKRDLDVKELRAESDTTCHSLPGSAPRASVQKERPPIPC